MCPKLFYELLPLGLKFGGGINQQFKKREREENKGESMVNIMLTKKKKKEFKLSLHLETVVFRKKFYSVVQNLPTSTSWVTLVWHLHMCCLFPRCFTEISNLQRKDWMFSQCVIRTYYQDAQLGIKERKGLKNTQGHRKNIQ